MPSEQHGPDIDLRRLISVFRSEGADDLLERFVRQFSQEPDTDRSDFAVAFKVIRADSRMQAQPAREPVTAGLHSAAESDPWYTATTARFASEIT